MKGQHKSVFEVIFENRELGMNYFGDIKRRLGDSDFMELLKLSDWIINEPFFIRKGKEIQRDMDS